MLPAIEELNNENYIQNINPHCFLWSDAFKNKNRALNLLHIITAKELNALFISTNLISYSGIVNRHRTSGNPREKNLKPSKERENPDPTPLIIWVSQPEILLPKYYMVSHLQAYIIFIFFFSSGITFFLFLPFLPSSYASLICWATSFCSVPFWLETSSLLSLLWEFPSGVPLLSWFS